MQHVYKMDPLTGHQLPVAPLSVTTIHPSPWERLSTRIKETGRGETITEIVLATVTWQDPEQGDQFGARGDGQCLACGF